MNCVQQAAIASLCKGLKLATLADVLSLHLERARKESLAYEAFLQDLLEAELLERQSRSAQRRLKSAGFVEMKALDGIEWEDLQGVTRQKVLELCSCEFLTKSENIVLAGPIGTGKTMLATAIGIEATRRGYNVLHRRTADLVRELIEARDERRLGLMQQQLLKVPLLIIDELGFVPFDRYGAELLFNLLADRHKRRSTIVTTNLAFGEWVQVFGCEKMTTALLDRFTENCHILITKGPSRRARKASLKSKQEVQTITP
jgi:DNA replication protein DnaC